MCMTLTMSSNCIAVFDINGKISKGMNNKMNIQVNRPPPSSLEMMMIVTVNFIDTYEYQ